MEFDDVLLSRRSIRGYKQEAVPKKVIEEVLELAVRAPSSMNTQPWHLYVITGDILDKIRNGNYFVLALNTTKHINEKLINYRITNNSQKNLQVKWLIFSLIQFLRI